MENKKDDLIVSITRSFLRETAKEQFEATLTNKQLEYIENSIWEGGLIVFMQDIISGALSHFELLKSNEQES